jgi:hypothetical protein
MHTNIMIWFLSVQAEVWKKRQFSPLLALVSKQKGLSGWLDWEIDKGFVIPRQSAGTYT